MGESTIQWVGTPRPDGTIAPGFTFNPWIGCDKVSPGCKHCYAEVETFPRVQRARGLELWGPKAHRHVTSDAYWRKPLTWNRAAQRERVRLKVFCASEADVFEDREDLLEPRERLAALVYEAPWLDWLFLTKRPENAERLWGRAGGQWWNNLWLGVSVENQEYANKRIPELLSTPAALKFISAEPLLDAIDLWPFLKGPMRLDWVIVGGESVGERTCAIEWVGTILSQCGVARVPAFVKQLGSVPVSVALASRIMLEHPKGGNPSEWPPQLAVRQWPMSRAL